MKVMHVTYDMRIGGTEMVIKNIVEGNTDANIEMSIYCIEAPLGPWGEDLKASGTSITIEERQPGFDISLISKMRKHIKENNIDILHCHQYTPWVYGTFAAAFTKTKIIFTEHGRFYPDSSSWKRRLINPLLLHLTDDIAAISEATRKALVEFEFIPESRVRVIYNGIAPISVKSSDVKNVRDNLRLSDSTVILGTIARLDPIKNQEMMLRAFNNVLRVCKDIHLVIVGDGACRKSLESVCDELNIKEHVTFTGYLSHPAEILGAMDLFLLSSLSEGTSMTLLEAMSLGKPCVVTDAGGNPEIIKHNLNGVVSRNGDTEGFANGIKSMLCPHTRKRLGRDGLLRFHSLFTNSVMSRSYRNIYYELCPQTNFIATK